jgi:hypothetical protein
MSMERGWKDTDRERPKYAEKILFPCVNFSTTNTTCTGIGLNPVFGGDRTANQEQPESQQSPKTVKEST